MAGVHLKRLAGVILAVVWLGAAPAFADDDAAKGEALLAKDCAVCHALSGPAPTTVAAVQARKGPDFFYAGNKYRREWLKSWLQAPVRIRPAGIFYADNLKVTDKWDVVDTAKLPTHVALSEDDAEAVAAALMTRKAKSALIEAVTFKPERLNLMMGDMLFDKFKGCIACHMSEPDYGGFSGPELFTAAKRLQPEYVYSYIQNPQAWDPKIWMPNLSLKEKDLNKLVRYMALIAERADRILAKQAVK